MTFWDRIAARLGGLRPCPIRELVAGRRGRAVGVVAPLRELEPAPWSGISVVAYRARLMRPEPIPMGGSRGLGSPGTDWDWETAARFGSTTSFWLVGDDGARALVEAANAILELPEIDVSRSDYVNSSAPDLLTLLRSAGVDPEPFTGLTGKARFYEIHLRDGDRVDVAGWVHRVDAGDPGDYRGRAKDTLGFSGTPESSLRIRRR